MTGFRRYGITGLVGLLIALPVWLKDGLFRTGSDSQRLLKALSNGTFLSAVLLIGLGLLSYVSREGLFDAFRYTMLGVLRGLLPKHRGEKRESYADYREARGRKKANVGHLIWVGMLFLVIALIAALLFEGNYQPPPL